MIAFRFDHIRNSLKTFQDFLLKKGNKFKIEEYLNYYATRIRETKINDYELEFDRSSLEPRRLPVEDHFKNGEGVFEVTQRVGFDNWVPMNVIKSGSAEIYL